MFLSSSIPQIGKPIKIGKPITKTASNHLLFRVGDISSKIMGARVVDASMTATIGTVYDLFGPVENPFLSVKLQQSGNTDNSDYFSTNYFAILEQKRPGTKKFLPKKFTKRG
nr:hypothetical protein [Candidatus Sigynarchaeota archaeon]